MVTDTWLINNKQIVPHTFFLEAGVFYVLWWMVYNNVCNTTLIKRLIDHLPINKRFEAKTRVISSLHAIMLSVASTGYLLNYIDFEKWVMILPVSSGYGLFDITLLTINYNSFKKGYIPTFIHHIIVIFGPLLIEHSISRNIVRLYLFETTVPILDMSWYLYNSGQTNTLFFKINSIVTVISYLTMRIINATHLTYVILINGNVIFLIPTLILLLLNLYWFKIILTVFNKFQ
tara:strand:- start:1 stop:696 length:696 start_codon:yes stop_codon:yes gene_type:complete